MANITLWADTTEQEKNLSDNRNHITWEFQQKQQRNLILYITRREHNHIIKMPTFYINSNKTLAEKDISILLRSITVSELEKPIFLNNFLKSLMNFYEYSTYFQNGYGIRNHTS